MPCVILTCWEMSKLIQIQIWLTLISITFSLCMIQKIFHRIRKDDGGYYQLYVSVKIFNLVLKNMVYTLVNYLCMCFLALQTWSYAWFYKIYIEIILWFVHWKLCGIVPHGLRIQKRLLEILESGKKIWNPRRRLLQWSRKWTIYAPVRRWKERHRSKEWSCSLQRLLQR